MLVTVEQCPELNTTIARHYLVPLLQGCRDNPARAHAVAFGQGVDDELMFGSELTVEESEVVGLS
jgi:hypothetical protein